MIDEILREDPWMLVPLLAIGGGFFIAFAGMVTCTIQKVSKTKQKEQSRREIAAYIAEGSMSPDEGERLLTAKS